MGGNGQPCARSCLHLLTERGSLPRGTVLKAAADADARVPATSPSSAAMLSTWQVHHWTEPTARHLDRERALQRRSVWETAASALGVCARGPVFGGVPYETLFAGRSE